MFTPEDTRHDPAVFLGPIRCLTTLPYWQRLCLVLRWAPATNDEEE
jgi:hypothetical protein